MRAPSPSGRSFVHWAPPSKNFFNNFLGEGFFGAFCYNFDDDDAALMWHNVTKWDDVDVV